MFAITLALAVASLALVKIYHRAVLAPEAERAARAIEGARACMRAGRTMLPSWVDDDSRTDAFTEALVAQLLRAGLPLPRIEAALTDRDFRIGVVSVAALLEAAGADYTEQLAGAFAFGRALVLGEESEAGTGTARVATVTSAATVAADRPAAAQPPDRPPQRAARPASPPRNRAPAPPRSSAAQ